jgi:hypothetical protein
VYAELTPAAPQHAGADPIFEVTGCIDSLVSPRIALVTPFTVSIPVKLPENV